MQGLRFSMSGAFAAITLVAVLFGLMVSQSQLSGSVAVTVFVTIVCLATAGTVATSGSDRLFWLGAAIFSWTYLLTEFEGISPMERLQSSPGVIMMPSGSSDSPQQSRMVSSLLVELVEQNMVGSRSIGATVMARWRGGNFYAGTITEIQSGNYLVKWADGSAPQWTPGSQILSNSPGARASCHAILGTLFGMFGGLLVSLVFGKRVSEKPS